MGKTKKAEAKVTTVQVVDLVPLQGEVQRVFDAVRDAVNPQLENKVIGKGKSARVVKLPTGRVVVNIEAVNGSRSKQATVLGHFADSQWMVDGELVNQIALSPYYLKRSAVDIVATLVHEHLHQIAQSSDIQDTSRQGRYHNSKFQELVAYTPLLDLGEPDKQVGVTTKASEELERWCKEELQPDFGDIKKMLEEQPAAKKPTTVRVECYCGTKATISVKQSDEGFLPLCDLGHKAERMTIIETDQG